MRRGGTVGAPGGLPVPGGPVARGGTPTAPVRFVTFVALTGRVSVGRRGISVESTGARSLVGVDAGSRVPAGLAPVGFALRPGTIRPPRRIGRVDIAGPGGATPARAPRIPGPGIPRILRWRPAAPRGAPAGVGTCAPGVRWLPGGAGPPRAASFVGCRRVGVVAPAPHGRLKFRDDATDEGQHARGFLGAVGGPMERAEVHPDQPDEQNPARGAQHQREALDQRIATVDQKVFEAAHLAPVEQPVGTGHGAEQDQRRLNQGREHRLLPHGQRRGHAAEHIESRKDGRQLAVSEPGVDGEPDGCGPDRDENGRPPRHARYAGVDRALRRVDPRRRVGRACRSGPLC